MPLSDIWKQDPSTVKGFTIEQMVTMAGDGNLRDGSQCSTELRSVIAEIESGLLFSYVDSCLTKSFSKSGPVLQDLVNELGRRLDYVVENGRYSGVRGAVGYDGIWVGLDKHAIVIEVKTSDAYRINLDTIGAYRRSLIQSGAIPENSSILIVVGRHDTGDLEAQVRGSRHAWDVRIISIDALKTMVNLKEKADEEITIHKLQSVDNIIDIMFTAASDVEAGEEAEEDVDDEANGDTLKKQERTAPQVIREFREKLISSASAKLEVPLIKKTRSTYWNATHKVRICCSVSKRYPSRDAYWYAYHPKWRDFLNEADRGYLMLACVGEDFGYMIPASEMESILYGLHTTGTGEEAYHHLIIREEQDGTTAFIGRGGRSVMSLDAYKISL